MALSADMLSRIQFAFTVSFHIIFPAFSIGLATFLAIMEGVYLKTKNPLYLRICKFWTKIFALVFGMGVVSGIVMEFQFGTNWSGFTNSVGSVLGSLFVYEVLTAFFIEAGFLGVMIFGWKKVSPKLHYAATLLVAFGVTLSAFWILSANSWMQSPDGVAFVAGKFVTTSWWHVIFNHMVFPRWIHMMLAAYITTAFVIAGVSAYYLLKKKHIDFSKKCLSFSTAAIFVLIIAQVFVGDKVGLVVHKYQPLKTAAIEGIWNTQKGAPLLLFAIPDMKAQKNWFPIKIPHGAALINTHQWDGKLIGLKTVSKKYQPYVPLVFFSFRIMVGLGLLMLLIGVIGLVLRIRKKLYDSPWFLKTCVYASPIGFLAIWTGWITAEAGRQPWVVYGYLLTSKMASPVSAVHVAWTFALLVLVYGIIFGVFFTRYFARILSHGPETGDEVLTDHPQPFDYMSNPHLTE